MNTVEIKITFTPDTGAIQLQHPDNKILALGLLEFAKNTILNPQQGQEAGSVLVAKPGAFLNGHAARR